MMTEPNGENGKSGWQKYILHMAAGVIGLLLTIVGVLLLMGVSHMRESINTGFTEMKVARQSDMVKVEVFFSENRKEMSRLCEDVQRHENYLRVPYDVRKNYFLTPKDKY